MQRYFVAAEQFHNQLVTILGDDAHHVQRVMRAQIGDKLICSDGKSQHVLAQIIEFQAGKVVAEVIEQLSHSHQPRIEVWIAQSLPKADKMELIIQKGTELGAARFIPYISERTIVHYDAQKEQKRTARWHKIAKEAAEQAHRTTLPEIDAVRSWQEVLHLASQVDVAWICYEKEQQQGWRSAIREALAHPAHRRFLVIIGPEGGFSEQEIGQVKQAHIQSVSLGQRILRTETAAWVALTCLIYESGEMGG